HPGRLNDPFVRTPMLDQLHVTVVEDLNPLAQPASLSPLAVICQTATPVILVFAESAANTQSDTNGRVSDLEGEPSSYRSRVRFLPAVMVRKMLLIPFCQHLLFVFIKFELHQTSSSLNVVAALEN